MSYPVHATGMMHAAYSVRYEPPTIFISVYIRATNTSDPCPCTVPARFLSWGVAYHNSGNRNMTGIMSRVAWDGSFWGLLSRSPLPSSRSLLSSCPLTFFKRRPQIRTTSRDHDPFIALLFFRPLIPSHRSFIHPSAHPWLISPTLAAHPAQHPARHPENTSILPLLTLSSRGPSTHQHTNIPDPTSLTKKNPTLSFSSATSPPQPGPRIHQLVSCLFVLPANFRTQ